MQCLVEAKVVQYGLYSGHVLSVQLESTYIVEKRKKMVNNLETLDVNFL